MGLTFAFDAGEPVGDDRNGRGDSVFKHDFIFWTILDR